MSTPLTQMSSIRQSTDSVNVGFENDFNGSLDYSAAGYDYSQQTVPHFGASSIAGGPTQPSVPDPRAFAAYNRIPTTFDQMGRDAADVTSYGEDAGQDTTAITGQSELRQYDALGQATNQSPSIQEAPSTYEVEEKSKKRIRKPAKPSGNESDDETSRKKHRGRPRLHPQEENAAERRRTQIRMAQRAYRMRKETTISKLTKQCSSLKEIVDEQQKTFLEFTAKFLQIQPSLDEEIREATRHFLLLAQNANEEPDLEHEERDVDGNLDRESPEVLGQKSGVSAAAIPASSGSAQRTVTSAWGYQIVSDEVGDYSALNQSATNTDGFPDGGRGMSDERWKPKPSTPKPRDADTAPSTGSQQYRAILDIPQVALYNKPFGSPLEGFLPPPVTYSSTESTFSRRLQRRSLEKAYFVMTDKNVPDFIVSKLFKFSFCYSSPEQIVERLKYLLAKSDQEDLEFWQAPMIHMGGSGTHFRNDRETDNTQEIEEYVLRSIGPQPLIRSEVLVDPCTSPEVMIGLSGFEGEWFDASDVERYLLSKGMRIGSDNLFAEIDVSVASSPQLRPQSPSFTAGSAQSSSRMTGHSPRTPAADLGAQNDDAIANDMLLPDAANAFNPSQFEGTGIMNMGSELADLNNPIYRTTASRLFAMNDATAKVTKPQNPVLQFAEGWAPYTNVLTQRRPTQKVVIDVNKLIEEISDRGLCLGRSPGFRQSSVDEALRSAQEVY